MIKVLLADDHAVVRDGLRALLEAQPDIRFSGMPRTDARQCGWRSSGIRMSWSWISRCRT